MSVDVNVAETNTENLFRTNYGAKTFVEKAAIPKRHGFLTKENIGKKPTDKDWSSGSLGKAHYVNGKFVASNLSIVMTEKDHNKYPLDMKVYSYYLNSLREQIVSDLEDGTSKLTINQDLFFKYPIKYIPWDEQIRLRAKIDAYEADKQALLAKSEALSSDFVQI